ncbi:MAG: hypothetical protein KJO07_08965 [Deltaproteobacteria bacterium]|nr:hypothetical protein [Deltaproteobacteria bacterium]
MRLRSWTLALALGLSGPLLAPAHADDSEQMQPIETPSIAVSAIMTEVGQALIWDAKQGEYVVIKVGQRIQGFRVRAIFPNQVVIEGKSPGQNFIFALTPRDKLNKKLKNSRRTPIDPYGANPRSRPIDPYAPTKIVTPKGPIPQVLAPKKSRASEKPIDPYAGKTTKVPSVKAPRGSSPRPVDPYGGPSKSKPGGKPMNPYAGSGKSKPVDPYANIPVVKAPPAKATPVDPYGGKVNRVPVAEVKPKIRRKRLSRRQFDRALSDFHSLSKELTLEPQSSGGFRVIEVARGSYFHRIGLRKGDVVLEVAGIKLRSVDDAASVYAQVASSKRFEAKLLRGGQPLVIKFRFSRR